MQRPQRFDWVACPPLNPHMPGGQWLGRLRFLQLPADVVASSCSELAAATQLRTLELRAWNPGEPAGLSLLPRAAQLPALRELCQECGPEDEPLQPGLLALNAARARGT
ncbi:hypothetical protein ABPG75_006878 [Micractinium tetrahymenae]